MIFVDTCILIDYSRGKIELTDEDFRYFYINSIVQLEFLAGALNKRELQKLNKILSKCTIVEIDQNIMNLSVQLINTYKLSHAMAIYDAIIASTCMIYDLPLWSYNKKDFKFLDIELLDYK